MSAIPVPLCIDCRTRPAAPNDGLCVECRAANTARNMAPANCACGRPLKPAPYRSGRCDECEREHLDEQIRSFGSE